MTNFNYNLIPLNEIDQNVVIDSITCTSINKLFEPKDIVKFIISNISQQKAIFWLAEYEGEYIGILGLRLSPKNYLRSAIYLHDHHQNKGHIKPLYSWLWQASQLANKPLQISIAKNNSHSLHAHKKLWPTTEVHLVAEKIENTGSNARISWVLEPTQKPNIKEVNFDIVLCENSFPNSLIWK